MTSQATRYLPCRAAGLRLAFDVDRLLGIRRADGIQRSPSDEGPIGWLLDYQDAPVFDVARQLGMETTYEHNDEDAGRVLLFEGQDGPFGLWVERSGRAQDVGGGTLHALPRLMAHLQTFGCVSLLTTDGHPWFVVDANTFHNPVEPPCDSSETSPGSLELPAPDGPSLAGGAPSQSFSLAAEKVAGGGRLVVFSTPQGDAFSPPVRFGLSLSQVLEVGRLPHLDPVPQAPPFVSGLTQWRQSPLLVLDVDRRMGWSHASVGDRLLVVHLPDGTHLGLVAHGQTRLLRLPIPHRLSELSLGHSLSLGIFDLADTTLIVPDLAAFGEVQAPSASPVESP